MLIEVLKSAVKGGMLGDLEVDKYSFEILHGSK